MATVIDPDEPGPTHVGAAENSAYEQGRLDERRRLERDGVGVRGTRDDPERAYAAGRRDARRRGGFSPLLGFLLLVVIVIGAVMIYLAVTHGSFSAGGQVVDNSLSNATAKVEAPVHNAADKAGDALQNAGSDLKQTAGSGKP